MPTRKRTRKRTSVVRCRGGGLKVMKRNTRKLRNTIRRKRGGSLWSWIKKKAVPWIKKKAVPWIRKKHLLSKAIGPMAGLIGGPMAGTVAGVAGNYLGQKYGFGKRRRRGAKRITYRRRRYRK